MTEENMEEIECITSLNAQEEKEEEGEEVANVSLRRKDIIYGINDVPPWYLCIALGAQQYIFMVGSTLAIPYFLTPLLCIAEDDPARGYIISSIIFVSGIVTLLQTTFGVRLPIVQGGTYAFLLPTIVILNTSFPSCDSYDWANMTRIEKDEVWMSRIREIQGAIIISSLFEIIIGVTGVIGYLLSWITPLTIVPTVTLLGLSLFGSAAEQASGHWGIAAFSALLMILFAQYLTDVSVPYPVFINRKVSFEWLQLFKLFPIILSITIAWAFCAILTVSEIFPEDSEARTDSRSSLLKGSPWFYIPYPFQWGFPTFSASGIIGMLAVVLSSVAESIGDYYTCAKLSGAGSLPKHAVNRGIAVEGIGCVICGIFGTGNGTTSYSDNIGAIRVTGVASRRVTQIAALYMILLGTIGKCGALFVTIPGPVIGGSSIVMIGLIVSSGLFNLHVVDLNSSRNLFILGTSLFSGLTISQWISTNKNAIETGSSLVDQVLIILFSTSMFLGGFIGLVLDNTIPGTDEERGLTKWNIEDLRTDEGQPSCYDLPLGMNFIKKWKWFKKIPISPTYFASSSN